MKFFFIIIIVAVAGFFLLKNNPQLADTANQWIAQVTKTVPSQKQIANTKKSQTASLSTNSPTLQKQILGIQQQVSQLKASDIASAPSQLQNIIKQIQA